MTAFARGEAIADGRRLSLEIRSVNHRYLDIGLRVPESLRAHETLLRERLRTRLERGKVELSLRVASGEETPALQIDAARLEALVAAAETTADALGARAAPIDPLAVLAWPGVLEQAAADDGRIADTLKTLCEDVLDDFVASRAREGARLAGLVSERLDGIERIVQQARAKADGIVAALRRRLSERVSALLAAEHPSEARELDPARLEQEVALLAQKADVAEELDRLTVHVAELRAVLTRPGPAGRRLDFLTQELNREANTLASKASTADASLEAVELKVLVEQIREQIQNIE